MYVQINMVVYHMFYGLNVFFFFRGSLFAVSTAGCILSVHSRARVWPSHAHTILARVGRRHHVCTYLCI